VKNDRKKKITTLIFFQVVGLHDVTRKVTIRENNVTVILATAGVSTSTATK